MTTVLDRRQGRVFQEPAVERLRSEAPDRKVNRFRTWMASLVAFVVVAGGAVAATVNQGSAIEPLSYRVIGESEALQRFGPGVAAVSGVEAGLSYRVIGESEALQRVVSGV